MLRNRSDRLALLGISLLVPLLLWLGFGQFFLHPSYYRMAPSGDGEKAYFTLSWYLKHGEGFNFAGFQHPHGTHIFYTDQNPVYTAVLGGWQALTGQDLSDQVIFLINLSVLLAFWPAAWLLYYILRRNLLPAWYAAGMALLITFLSPQIDRFTGHFALAYVCFVPLVWYCLIHLFEKNRLWGTVWFGLVSTLFTFIHPYHGLIALMFLLAYMVVEAWQEWDQVRQRWPGYLATAGVGILPLVLIKGVEFFTRSTPDGAVKVPYGFLNYVAGMETIFVPTHAPFRTIWDYFIRVKSMTNEGYAYVGFVGLLVLVFVIIRLVQLARRQQWGRIFRPVLPHTLQVSLWAAFLVLLPAMAIPFKWYPEMLEYLGPIRQFRSLGRAAWVFYYVWMVFSAWYLYALMRYFRQQARGSRLGQVGVILLSFCVLSWTLEAWILVKVKADNIRSWPRNQLVEWDTDFVGRLAENGYQPEDFQAILALPYFHHGSEKLVWQTYLSNKVGFGLALDTGLPLVQTIAARASVAHTLEALQLTSHPLLPRTWPAQLTDKRPLLLVYVHGVTDFMVGEEWLIARADSIARWEYATLARLDLTDLASEGPAKKAAFFADSSLQAQPGPWYTQPANSPVYWEGFGDGAGAPLGEQAQMGQNNGVLLFDRELDLPAGTRLEVSAWAKVDRETNYLPNLYVQQYQGETRVGNARVSLIEGRDVYQEWVLGSDTLEWQGPGNRLTLSVDDRAVWFDRVLVRPLESEVFYYQPGDSTVWYNNFPL